MGRDDAKPVPGLQGGTAPARAFHDFMMVAVANRPVEQFETQVPMPDWQLTPEEEMYGDQPADANDMAPMMVDENGMPLGNPPPQEPGTPQLPPMVRPDGTGEPTQQELDQAFPPQQPRQQGYPPRQPPTAQPPQRQPQRQAPPGSAPTPDPLQPRPDPS
jgi:penicillin-binding protein 1A